MPPSEARAPRQAAVRTALAGLIGNVLEWFDFAAFGFLASDIGRQFFPDSSASAQKLKAFAVFAIGFGGRPIGSIVLGRVGDRIGRRALLTLSIALMGGATLLLGLLPGYAQIGVAAPVLLVTLRLIQGFSLGGEFTGSMVYTTELASPLWRGLVSSSTAAGTTIGFILGSATVGLLTWTMGAEQVASWGWRIPFIGSVVFLIVGWLLRRGIRETEEGQKAAATRPPIWSSIAADWRPIIQTFGIVAMTNAAYYLAFTFALDRRKTESSATASEFLRANTLSLTVVLLAKPLGGWLSDRMGRRRLMMGLTVAGMALIYVALKLMLNGSSSEFMLGQMLLGLPLGMALGLQGAMVVEIFPLRTRVTSMSVAYSVTLALSGGIAPFVATWLIDVVGQPTAPAFYIMLYGVIGLAILWPMKETNTRPLDQ
ncbi:MAG TPA: MFS transporter [Kofleriaceae bacterium]|nr:MFS transporter [Kofleriaceae bacterium]